jgi:replication factor A1
MEESAGTSSEEQQASVETKIKDLTPQSKRVDVNAKVLEVSEPKDIPGKFGNSRKVAEANVSDETGAIVLSLWDNQIGSVAKDDVIEIKNGYVSLVRGHMRLNVGKYGTLAKSEKPMETNTTLNMSDKEYEQERRSFGGGGGRGGGRGGYGGGGRDRRGGYGDRGGDRDSGDRPSYMNKGRRRF